MKFNFFAVLFFLPTAFVNSAWSQNHTAADIYPHYDEVYNDKKALRPQYEEFKSNFAMDPNKAEPQLEQELFFSSPFGDKIRILPFPLILTEKEYSVITKGVQQTGRALARFFDDFVVSKKMKGASENGGFIPEGIARQIFNESGYSLDVIQPLWEGVESDRISFLLGPDLVRNPQGQWVALEYNVNGNMGGAGDHFSIHSEFSKRLSSVKKSSISPQNELHDLIIAFFEHFFTAPELLEKKTPFELFKNPRFIALHANHRLFKYSNTADANLDLEFQRLSEQILEFSFKEKVRLDDLFRISDEQLSNLDTTRCGFLNFEQLDSVIDDWYSVTQDCFQRQKIPFLLAPGTKALGHKGLLPFIEEMIRFYLNEEPIIKPQPSKLLTPHFETNINKLDLTKNVVKKGKGCQGRDVEICPIEYGNSAIIKNKLISKIFPFLIESKRNGLPEPIYIAQEFVHPSVITLRNLTHANPSEKYLKHAVLKMENDPWIMRPKERFTVDIRPISLVLGLEKVHVSSTPWGRATSEFGQFKQNVSQGAVELVVHVEPYNCETLLEKAFQRRR